MTRFDSTSVCVPSQDLGSSAGTLYATVRRILIGCALVTAGAQLRIPIPFTEVPMTLQLLGVLVVGLMFRPAEALGALVVYLGLGAAGVPLFAAGSAGLAGSTGGYLVGFALAAWLISCTRGGRNASTLRLLAAAFLGTLAVFGTALVWRTMFFGGGLGFAVQSGLLPFIVKAVIEVFIAVSMARVVCVRRTV